jgi:F0F1-type ATP synthase epsilon subunit
MTNQPLHVRVNSPEKIIWEGEAESVSSQNTEGPFDILPMHSNFITIIDNREIRIKTSGGTQIYKFNYSVIYAHSNQVKIYTNL